MRLTKLEIKGFKSFGNDTVIHFSNEVTGIVGPNGSGKSNVVDAIRWVLGEQRTTGLRLEKMGDVIFNGSKKRKAASTTMVAITFDNDRGLLPSEYSEVTISRSLFRSGHSEYRINNVNCRLKDIHNLLVDTGISSNSYAIIELGMIDDILSDKENARRRMFEQAAGISKYKRRKRETLLKLKATNADLERVQDLLHEIEANLRQLEKQARKARRYLKLKEEYKEKSIESSVYSLQAAKRSHSELQKKIADAQDQYHAINAQIRRKEASVESEKEKHLGKETTLSSLQKSLNEFINRIRSLENDVKLAEQEIGFSNDTLEKEAERVKSEREKVHTLRSKQGLVSDRLEQSVQDLAECRRQLAVLAEQKLEHENTHGQSKSEHQEMIDAQIRLEKRIMEAEKELALLANTRGETEESMKRYESERSGTEERIGSIDARSKLLEEQMEAKAAYLRELRDTMQEKKDARARLEERRSKIREDLAAIGRKIDARKNEYQLTKSMVDSLEGYPESIKFLSRQKGWQRDAVLFSEILQCPEEYRSAVESYLEPFLNYYVVPDLETAVEGVDKLKQAQKGKAYFFVLETFRNEQETADDIEGYVPAVELISMSDPYRKLISHLLYNVYIRMDHEIPSLEQLPGGNTYISRDGHLMRTGNTVSGGSLGLFDGKKIGRKKNLQKLEKDIQILEKKYEALTVQSIDLKNDLDQLADHSLEQIIEEHKGEVEEIRVRMSHLAAQKDTLQTRLQSDTKLQEERTRRIGELAAKSARLAQETAGLTDELTGIKDVIARTSGRLETVSRALSDASGAFNEKNLEVIRLDNQAETHRKELQFLKSQEEALLGQIEERERNIRTHEGKIKQNEELIRDADLKKIEMYQRKGELESELNEKEQEYYRIRNEIHEAEKEIQVLYQNQRKLQSLINTLKDEFNEWKMKINSITQRTQVEFNIEPDEILKQELVEDYDPEKTDERVEWLRNRLAGFGEVNPLAVEAYEEMENRYNGICEQRDDIVLAQERLEKTIEELEATATEKFMEAYEQVRIHFRNIFRTLFSAEDDSDLILLDPANPLESQIEIVARPKGKKPVTLSQLSGGEKTLTATALLFGLYLLKPAPFCVFDEVDAPLDDANIQKFNRIIKKFSRESQFVVITHNKLTMAAVDVIYGVYMEEPGISSVTPVDFRNFVHEPLPVEIT